MRIGFLFSCDLISSTASLYIWMSRITRMTGSSRNPEPAVSPVIGTILMVAITVILSAVIAVYFFGFGDSVEKPQSVALIVAYNVSNPSTIDINNYGGPDMAHIRSFRVLVNGEEKSAIIPLTNDVGSRGIYPCDGGINHRVIIVAVLADGDEQILVDKNM